MVQSTSVEALRQITLRGIPQKQQRKILEVFIADLGSNFTNLEISRETGLPINCVCPRMKELRGKGYLKLACKRRQVTGYRANAWELDTAAILQRDMEREMRKPMERYLK